MLTEEIKEPENKHLADSNNCENIQVIKAKLMHAKNATLMCILDFEKLLNEIEPGDYMDDLKGLLEFVSLWDSLLLAIDNPDIEKHEIGNMLNQLSSMPRLIRKHYDTLILADPLIEEHTTEEPIEIAFV